MGAIIADDAATASPPGRAGLELELHPDLEPAAEAALTLDLSGSRYEGVAGPEHDVPRHLRTRRRLASVGVKGEDAQIVPVQEIEHFQEGGGRGVPDHEGLAQIEVDVQRRVVALAVAADAFEFPAQDRVEDRGSEDRAVLEVIFVVQSEEARDQGIRKTGGPGHCGA